MSIVFALLLGVPLLAFVGWRAWAFFSGPRVLSAQPPGAVPAMLTVTGVAPEHRSADERGPDEAFCTISGFLAGPGLAPTEVYRRVVIPAQGHWPRVGEELDAHHLPGRSATHWWLDPAVGWHSH